MNWAPTILRIRDISIKMHVTFLLLLAFEAWIWSTHGITGIAFGVGLTILLFTCVVLHELGHAFAARTVGIPVREILLLPIGGIAYLSRAPKTPRDELWIAVAGPLVAAADAGGRSRAGRGQGCGGRARADRRAARPARPLERTRPGPTRRGRPEGVEFAGRDGGGMLAAA
jgi:hypothetical protein